MSIYTAKTHTTYRGFLIEVRATCDRSRHGRRRRVTATVRGHFPDVFDRTYPDHFHRTYTLDGNDYTIIDASLLTFRGTHHRDKTYLDERHRNWPAIDSPFEFLIQVVRQLRTPRSPTPLSQQIATVLDDAEAAIDQYIEDRSIEFDTTEFRHGLETSLHKPVEDISVKRARYTGARADETTDRDRITAALEAEAADAD